MPESNNGALSECAAHVERIVKQHRQAAHLEESKAAFNTYRRRELTCHFAEDGSLVFEGRLPPEAGALLMQALDRGVEWLFRGQPHRRRLTRDEAKIQDVPLEERRADALTVLAERFLAQPPGEEDGLRTADRFQVTVHASAESLPEYAAVEADDPPQVENGPVLATETVRRISCDCSVVRILESGDGEPWCGDPDNASLVDIGSAVLARRSARESTPWGRSLRSLGSPTASRAFGAVRRTIFSRGDGTVVLRETDRQLMGSVERWLEDQRWRRGYLGNIPGQGTVHVRDLRAPRVSTTALWR